MPISTVKFHSLNADPLPDPSVLRLDSVAYGGVVGGDAALDAKDTAGSYVTIGDFGSSHTVVTCRPVIDPPIPFPAGAAIQPDNPTDNQADFAAFQLQVAYGVAPTMPIHGGPDPVIGPSFAISRASDGLVLARSIAEGRDSLDTAWGAGWWDETNCGTLDDPPAWTEFTAINQPGLLVLLDPSDYLVIWFNGPELWISQIVGQITWQPTIAWHTIGGHWSTIDGTSPMRINTPGYGWVDIVDGLP